jgi:hypothetical protein
LESPASRSVGSLRFLRIDQAEPCRST